MRVTVTEKRKPRVLRPESCCVLWGAWNMHVRMDGGVCACGMAWREVICRCHFQLLA